MADCNETLRELETFLDDELGAEIYTSALQESISQANDPPPVARELALFSDCMFYANLTTRHRRALTMLGPFRFTTPTGGGPRRGRRALASRLHRVAHAAVFRHVSLSAAAAAPVHTLRSAHGRRVASREFPSLAKIEGCKGCKGYDSLAPPAARRVRSPTVCAA